jgi:hypothetical protein
MGSEIAFLPSKLIQKGIWFPIFIVHKSKAKAPKWPPFMS